MEIYRLLISLLGAATLAFLLIRPKIGAMLYMIHMFLAPWIYIGGFQIYSRTLAFLFIFLFVFQLRNMITRENLKPLFPYMFFLAANFLILFTAERFNVSLTWYLFTLCDFFFMLYLYGNIVNYKSATLYKWTLFTIMCFIVAYGLFLTTIPGLNPYKLIQMPIFEGEFNEAYAAGNSGSVASTELAEGRMFGRISSVFDHPMTYGLNLGLFAIFSSYILRNRPPIMTIVLVAVLIAILTSGVRTPIAALTVTALFALLYLRKIRYFWYGFIGAIALLVFLPLILPGAEEYLTSIVSPDESNTSGSSLSMRLTQLKGSFDIMSENPLFGNGYGWHYWYNGTYGAHPKALYFESIMFTIMVETGIAGFIIWFYFISKYCKYCVRSTTDRLYSVTLLSLMVYYLSYSLITGDMGIKNLMPFFVVLLGIHPNHPQIRAK